MKYFLMVSVHFGGDFLVHFGGILGLHGLYLDVKLVILTLGGFNNSVSVFAY